MSAAEQRLERVVAALSEHDCRPTRSGDGWAARCPAHEDRSPSLTLSEGRDGRVLLHCHAGCTFDGIIAALGLAASDVSPPSEQRERDPVVAEYRYQAADGKHLFTVSRTAGKRFWQTPANGKKGAGSMRGVPRVPYRLPRVLEAMSTGVSVYIVEGEKDVHAIETAGATATCNPGGAGKFSRELAAHLAGADVVIVPDRDQPGYEHALAVHRLLDGVAGSVRFALPTSGKDAADHLARGRTLDQLEAATAKELQRLRDGDSLDEIVGDESEAVAPESADPGSWKPRRLLASDKPPSEPPSILGLFYAGKRHWLTGEAEAGKSWLAYAACIDQLRAGRAVVVIDWENGEGETRERFDTLGADLDDHVDLLLYVDPDDAVSQAGLDAISALGPSLVVADACASLLGVHGWSPNSEEDLDALDRRILKPLAASGAAVVVIDHPVKDKEARGLYSSGSARKRNLADVAYLLTRKKPFGRGRAGLSTITVSKDRPGRLGVPSGQDWGSFHLEHDVALNRAAWSVRRNAVEDDTRSAFRPTHLMERVSRYLEGQPTPPSMSRIECDVPGKATGIRAAVERLLLEGYAAEEAGERNARLVRLVKLYREADDRLSDAYNGPDPVPSSTPRPDPVPDGVRPTPSRSSPRLYYGDERDGVAEASPTSDPVPVPEDRPLPDRLRAQGLPRDTRVDAATPPPELRAELYRVGSHLGWPELHVGDDPIGAGEAAWTQWAVGRSGWPGVLLEGITAARALADDRGAV